MKIIAFVGMPAAGKSVASVVARDMDIPVVNMGDAVREETKKRGLPGTDENIGGMGTRLREEEGMDAIARRCIPKIWELDSPVVVVDGIRNLDEVIHFKSRFGNDFQLIAIQAPLDIRFERIKARARSDDMENIEELIRRDERERTWGLDKAIEMADVTITNNDSLERFCEEIKNVLVVS